ncbi:MAG: ABC transporter permease [Eubacterium sp.]|nr:ABC transporter permease [Eubacterium sp.]
MLKTLYTNSYLLRKLVKKDIRQRYQGSVLGVLWSMLVPVFMLAIYTFIFSEVFQAKWNMDTTDTYQFALMLFCGLSAFNLLGEVMNRSTTLVASHANYVKKVIFPLEILPVVLTLSALFHCVVSYGILIAAKCILYRSISPTLYLFLPAMVPLVVLAVGTGLFIAAISVYLKDVGNVISVIVTVLMYISPVFFPLDAVPQDFRVICEMNPMTYMIENFRNVVLYGKAIDLPFFAVSCAAAFAVYLIGYMVFMRTKEGFADVI